MKIRTTCQARISRYGTLQPCNKPWSRVVRMSKDVPNYVAALCDKHATEAEEKVKLQ